MSTAALESSVKAKSGNRTLSKVKFSVQSATRNWSGKALFTLMDQGLISSAGFVITIVLARTLVPRQYGAFALAYMIFMFLTILYNAFILEPLAVFGSSIYRDSLRKYMGMLLRLHVLGGVIVVSAVGISAWIFMRFVTGKPITWALLAAAIAAPCVLLFRLARRAFYVELRPRDAVLGGTVYFSVVVAGLLVLWELHELSPAKAFLLMAASGLVTAATVLVRLRSSLPSGGKGPGLSAVLRRHWEYGRWAAGSAVAIWFGQALFYPLLTSLQGLPEAGKLKALMNFSSPVSQIFVAVTMLSLPYASRVYHRRGPAAARRLVWKFTSVYAGGTILYWAVLIVWRGPLIHLLYGGKYRDITYLMPWIALSSVLRISATAHAVTLRAMHMPWLVFVAYSGSCLAAVLIGVPCAWAFGLHGAVIAVALSGAVAFLIVVAIVHRRNSTPVNLPVMQRIASDPLA